MSEWRPIESAPKDGTVVLLANPSAPAASVSRDSGALNKWGPVVIGAWHQLALEEVWVQVDAETKKLKRTERGEWVGPMDNPTHWMPLPAPPEGS